MNFHKLLGALWRFFLCCVLKVYGGLQTISAPQVRQDQLLPTQDEPEGGV